jgi:hypothetical protein
MERTVKHIVVLAVAFAFWAGGALYGQVKAVMPKMSADSAAVVQARADHYVTHHWEGVDLAGFKALDIDSEPEPRGNAFRLEDKLAAYFWILRMASDSVAEMSVKNLMDSVAEVCGKGEYPTGYDKLLAAAEKYFYSLQSPYYSEKRLIPFLEHKIGRADVAEAEKSREKYLVSIIRRNMAGTMALDVELCDFDAPGESGKKNTSLHKVLGGCSERQMLMVVFFSSGCRDCHAGMTRLEHSTVVRKMMSEGELAVLAVCIEGRASAASSLIKKGWMVASDAGAVVQNSLYSVRNTPSVYILERGGEVLIKDASVSSAIDFLLGLQF